MKTINKILMSALTLAAISACSTTTVIPQVGNIYTVEALSSSTEKAKANAMAKAKLICQGQVMTPTILDEDMEYQGISTAQEKLIGLASKILPEEKTNGPYTPPNHDYKATISFRCEK
jgi:hypothetical protein